MNETVILQTVILSKIGHKYRVQIKFSQNHLKMASSNEVRKDKNKIQWYSKLIDIFY